MDEKKAIARRAKAEGLAVARKAKAEEVVDKILDWYDGLTPQQHAALQQFLAGSKASTTIIEFPLPPYSKL